MTTTTSEEYSSVIKCVIIGDSRTGKTNLLSAYWNSELPATYSMTVFDNYTAIVKVNDQQYLLDFWDSSGHRDYDYLRPLCYEGCDIFLLCFSVMNRATFENVTRRWVPEIQRYAPDTPFILVGNKLDERENEFPNAHDFHHNVQYDTDNYYNDDRTNQNIEVKITHSPRYRKLIRLLERNNHLRTYSIPNPILQYLIKNNSETQPKKKSRFSLSFLKKIVRASFRRSTPSLPPSYHSESHTELHTLSLTQTNSPQDDSLVETLSGEPPHFNGLTSHSNTTSIDSEEVGPLQTPFEKQRKCENSKKNAVKQHQNEEQLSEQKESLEWKSEMNSNYLLVSKHKTEQKTSRRSKSSQLRIEERNTKSHHTPEFQYKSKLSSLPESCHKQQLHSFHASFQLLKESDIISLLPEEIFLKILRYLTDEELCRCASVSKLWLRLTSDDSLWKELLHRLVPDVNSVLNEHPVYKMHQRICWKNLYLEKLVEVEMRGPVWYSEGVRLAKELGAVKYLENSAVTKRGLKTVIDEAIRTVLAQRHHNKRKKQKFKSRNRISFLFSEQNTNTNFNSK